MMRAPHFLIRIVQDRASASEIIEYLQKSEAMKQAAWCAIMTTPCENLSDGCGINTVFIIKGFRFGSKEKQRYMFCRGRSNDICLKARGKPYRTFSNSTKSPCIHISTQLSSKRIMYVRLFHSLVIDCMLFELVNSVVKIYIYMFYHILASTVANKRRDVLVVMCSGRS